MTLQILVYSLIGAGIIATIAILGPYFVQYGPGFLSAVRRRYLSVEWHGIMSRIADDDLQTENGDFRQFSPDETNSETAETPQRVGEIQRESFTLGETTALARLVASGKLGLTDAVKIGADAKSGEKYQRRTRDIKAAVESMTEKYPQRTPEQEALRKQLKLG